MPASRTADELPVSTAAPPVSPARESAFALVADELVRDTRERATGKRLAWRARLTFALAAGAFVAAAICAALFLDAGARFSWPIAAVYVAVYAAVSRVKFEVGTGSAIPTQLVLVPMFFALPVGMVPGLVAVALVLAAAVRDPRTLVDDRLLPLLASAAQTLGPALVLGLAGGTPLRASAWPIYLAALAAQFGVDFASAGVTSAVGHGVPVRTLARFIAWVFVVDAALAPIGLAVAFATEANHAFVVLVLPLVALLRHFSHERELRIDNALELSDAYRGTAFLLGDVVEADDHYTGTHSRHVVDLVLGVCDELGLGPDDRRDAEFVALLHDVGKIRIPGSIINKPGPLDADEWAADEAAHDRGRADAGAGRRPARPRRPDRALVPRALGRRRLPGWARRRGDPVGRARRGGLRRLQRDDDGPRLPPRALTRGGDRRASSLGRGPQLVARQVIRPQARWSIAR